MRAHQRTFGIAAQLQRETEPNFGMNEWATYFLFLTSEFEGDRR